MTDDALLTPRRMTTPVDKTCARTDWYTPRRVLDCVDEYAAPHGIAPVRVS